MLLPDNLVEGVFLSRLNRFCVAVRVEGQEALAHLPNSGRLRELLQPGRRLLLAPRKGRGRRTPYDLALVDLGHALASADARLPLPLLVEALQEGRVEALRGYKPVRREVAWGHSRLDLLLHGPRGPCLVEVKSVTLVVDGVGLFPDAPTERGRRHLEALVQASRQGREAAVVFVVQRGDARAFAPHREADPAFARLLAEAVQAGVRALAYRCRVTPREIALQDPVAVLI